MRCRKAKEYYLSNRDGLLGEADRIRLQQHLEVCSGCADFASEMDACLCALDGLPEMEVSDNFDWNLRMKIAREKSRMMRDKAAPLFSGSGWGVKFVASMAATLVIVLAGAFILMRDGGPEAGNPAARVAERQDAEAYPAGTEVDIDYTGTGYPAGIRMVSDEMPGAVHTGSYARQSPFSMDDERRLEYLVKENEALKKYLERYKAENAYLKKLLLQKGSQR